MQEQVFIKYLNNSKNLYPELSYASDFAAGLDLRANIAEDVYILPAASRLAIPTGLAIEIVNPNIAAFVYSRSGLGAKNGVTVAQGVGVIDPDYRGEIIVYLLNTSSASYLIKRGERIAQLVFQPICRPKLSEVDELSATVRGTGAFGHTGKE